ncbi:GNAT family N-acetyltransferase (plasmid) [Bosea sp. F3-2]|uniref:GNAT family N-acetyltransferase n=1 Tax=Bosea sp. F3-2 TaxID=2599640 RepID=UPI0011ED460E|nr:GNAT family N-acetyltransferase [Bosea sp. F3-2]QEL26895.1 GNAT family N-acetyltransferase [Bosea sp. F3-2]
MILEHAAGDVRVVMSPEVSALVEPLGQNWTVEQLQKTLAHQGITLNGADLLHHYSEAETRRLARMPMPEGVRRLGPADAELFAAFQAEVSLPDLDAAYVELEHWAAFGAFSGKRLVAAGSIYPWMNSAIGDIGVLTLVSERGRGFGRNVVLAMSTYAVGEGLHPQFRCQRDNSASAALGKSAGLQFYGNWTAELRNAVE